MKIDFDADKDSVAQARLLVGALSEWLAEQPEQEPPCGGKALFTYRADHSLDNVRIVMDESE